MKDDLEVEIRDALRVRAQAVTATDLRRTDDGRDHPTRRNVLAALAAAAAVAALAVGIGVVVWPSSDKGPTPQPATGGAGVIGVKWQFEHGIQGTTTFTSPSGRVSIAFYREGKFGADDGINYLGGPYVATADGLRIGPAGSTLVGYAGHDPNVLATQIAFGALTGGRAPVSAKFNDQGELVLSGPGYSLWFRNAGPSVAPSESASFTKTPGPTR